MNKSKYKITIHKNGIGYKFTLWRRVLFFFWLPDAIQQDAGYGVPYNDVVINWQEHFSIPDDYVIFKF